MLRRYSTLWVLVLAVWMLIGLSFTLNYYFFAAHYVSIFSQAPTLGQMLVWELPYWLLWAGLAPVVFLFNRRFPIDRERWFRNSLLHIVACVALTIAHRAIYLILGWLLHVAAYQNLTSIPDLYSSDILFNLPTGFMSYGTIFLISYVIDYYRRHQEEELNISRLKTELAEARLQVTEAQLQALKMQHVRDNGPGLGSVEGGRAIVKEGVGLANTRARLAQMYGPAHRFEMAAAPEGGLQVTLTIPFESSAARAQEQAAIV